MLKIFRYFKFRAFQNGNTIVGVKRKATDDQSTCRADNRKPKSRKYGRYVYFDFKDVLVTGEEGPRCGIRSEYEAKKTTISGNKSCRLR